MNYKKLKPGQATKPNESANEIAKNVASRLLKVQLDDSHISISQRLPKTKTSDNDQVHYNNAKVHPPIILRFSNRDKRNELF